MIDIYAHMFCWKQLVPTAEQRGHLPMIIPVLLRVLTNSLSRVAARRYSQSHGLDRIHRREDLPIHSWTRQLV